MAQVASAPQLSTNIIQFVFTSDAHYGLTHPAFRGASDVPAHVVNAALIDTINALPSATFAEDGGVRAGQRIGALDFVVEGRDIANRQEGEGVDAIQRAEVS